MKNADTRRKYYKDGNPELYKSFTDVSWKNMTSREKAMWTPAEESEEAPIPQEVLDFTKQNSSVIVKDKEIAKLKARVSVLEAENEALRKECASNCRPEPTRKTGKKESIKVDTEEVKLNLVREELRKMGEKFAWNAKLPNLQAKLDKAKKDATNTK